MAGFNISSKNFGKLLLNNGYRVMRQTGSHAIYKNGVSGVVISVPIHLNPIIAQRLIREHNLKVSS
ncbi:MAG: type II toxin-antitoxin system HicA family toxin [Methanobrevibacter sp.]|nr:type II toxin-antitoxin system HicA family toxin [Methanobrevibacter sp.]